MRTLPAEATAELARLTADNLRLRRIEDAARMLDNLDPELEHAWSVIARVYGNLLCHDWRTGEIWQYMGTYHRADAWSHHFRHRCLPATGKRTVYKVAASVGWTP